MPPPPKKKHPKHSTNWKRYTNPNVHSSIVCNRHPMEAPYVSINRWRDNEDVSINTMEYYSAIKRTKFCCLQQHVDLEGIIISEVSQTEKDKYCMILYMESKKDNKVVSKWKRSRHRCREQSSGYHWGGGRGRDCREVVTKGVIMALHETMYVKLLKTTMHYRI